MVKICDYMEYQLPENKITRRDLKYLKTGRFLKKVQTLDFSSWSSKKDMLGGAN